ncbi:hypothetical protein DFH06DRAFT_1140857 [Mycena polygramma]|nr:hypothetical protein DFH06DRAFT_1140857 [Mycena polygramma]
MAEKMAEKHLPHLRIKRIAAPASIYELETKGSPAQCAVPPREPNRENIAALLVEPILGKAALRHRLGRIVVSDDARNRGTVPAPALGVVSACARDSVAPPQRRARLGLGAALLSTSVSWCRARSAGPATGEPSFLFSSPALLSPPASSLSCFRFHSHSASLPLAVPLLACPRPGCPLATTSIHCQHVDLGPMTAGRRLEATMHCTPHVVGVGGRVGVPDLLLPLLLVLAIAVVFDGRGRECADLRFGEARTTFDLLLLPPPALLPSSLSPPHLLTCATASPRARARLPARATGAGRMGDAMLAASGWRTSGSEVARLMLCMPAVCLSYRGAGVGAYVVPKGCWIVRTVIVLLLSYGGGRSCGGGCRRSPSAAGWWSCAGAVGTARAPSSGKHWRNGVEGAFQRISPSAICCAAGALLAFTMIVRRGQEGRGALADRLCTESGGSRVGVLATGSRLHLRLCNSACTARKNREGGGGGGGGGTPPSSDGPANGVPVECQRFASAGRVCAGDRGPGVTVLPVTRLRLRCVSGPYLVLAGPFLDPPSVWFLPRSRTGTRTILGPRARLGGAQGAEREYNWVMSGIEDRNCLIAPFLEHLIPRTKLIRRIEHFVVFSKAKQNSPGEDMVFHTLRESKPCRHVYHLRDPPREDPAKNVAMYAQLVLAVVLLHYE